MNSLQNRKKPSIKKRIFLVLVVLLLVAGGILGYLYAVKAGPFDEPVQETKTSTSKDGKDGSSTPQTDGDLGVNPPEESDPTSNSVKNPPADETPPSDSKDFQITFAHVNGDTFQIRTLIAKVTSSGTCKLTMTSGSRSYSASAGVQPMASSSTCKGFNVPMSSLSSGTWRISIIYSFNGTESTATKEVVINA